MLKTKFGRRGGNKYKYYKQLEHNYKELYRCLNAFVYNY
jgi:hypothetical protein